MIATFASTFFASAKPPRWSLLLASLVTLIIGTATFSAALATEEPLVATTRHFGFKFPNRITLENETLQLNGVGGRGVSFLKVYASALYLRSPAKDNASAFKMSGNKRLQIRMAYTVDAKEFKKALIRGIEKNYSLSEQTILRTRTLEFGALIDALGKVRNGDIIDMDYSAQQQSMSLRVNDKLRGKPISGADFYQAVLAIFIGEVPTDEAQKNRLLGG